MRWDIMWSIARRKLVSLRGDRRTAAFVVVMPTLVIILFVLAIGGDPQDLEVAVVFEDDDVGGSALGDVVLAELQANHSESLVLVHHVDLASAIDAVERGEQWAVIHIRAGFSESVVPTISPIILANESQVENGTISVRLDASNQQVQRVIVTSLNEALLSVLESQLGVEPSLPMALDEPIYGDSDPSFTSFLAPGIITFITFVFSLILTAMTMVNERHDGTIERLWAAGVKPSEVIVGHLTAWIGVLVAQVTVMLFVAFAVHDISTEGPIIAVFVQAVVLGIAAMSYGLFISSKARTEFQALQLALATFLPVLLISGIIWPVEALPKWLSPISWALPTTWSADAIRSIMVRGWGFGHARVRTALLVTALWASALLFGAIRSLKARR